MIPLQTTIIRPSFDPGNPVIASSKNKTNSITFTFGNSLRVDLNILRFMKVEVNMQTL